MSSAPGPRPARPEEGRALAVRSMPWLVALGHQQGLTLERAAAIRVPGAVLVRGTGIRAGTRAVAVFELPDRDPTDVALLEGAPPTRSARVVLPAALAPELERFHARMRWLGGDAEAGPSDGERAILQLADRLRGLRRPADAGAIEVHGTSATEHAVALFLATVAGEVREVLALDPDTRGRLPQWLTTWLVLAEGEVAPLLALAAAPAEAEGALELVRGAALAEGGLTEAALRVYRDAAPDVVGAVRADAHLEIARLERTLGRTEAAIRQARGVLLSPVDEGAQARAIEELLRCGSHDDVHAWLSVHVPASALTSPAARALATTLAELLLWAARTDDAAAVLARLGSDPQDPRLARAVGVRHALAGAHEDALAWLSRAEHASPRDVETRLWLAEVNLRLGRREEALRHTKESHAQIHSPIHDLLEAALSLEPGGRYVPPALERLLAVIGEELAPWRIDPTRAALAVLGRFGGNRSAQLTLHDDRAPGLGLAPLVVPPLDATLSARDASAALARAIGTMPPEEHERRFAALVDAYPESPHPLCYWGEVDLWRGETERAIARFEAALLRGEARWAYVGRAAAHVLAGRWAEAEAVLAALPPQFPPTLGATTPVYLGEMWRRRGEPHRAIPLLREAVSSKPGRIGAWMNLALAHLARGERDDADAIAARLEGIAPHLLWDAWAALGGPPAWPIPRASTEAVYLKVLEHMRGNRSSHTITYFDRAGTMRIVRPLPALRDALARHAQVVAAGLRDRIASGLEHHGGLSRG